MFQQKPDDALENQKHLFYLNYYNLTLYFEAIFLSEIK